MPTQFLRTTRTSPLRDLGSRALSAFVVVFMHPDRCWASHMPFGSRGARASGEHQTFAASESIGLRPAPRPTRVVDDRTAPVLRISELRPHTEPDALQMYRHMRVEGLVRILDVSAILLRCGVC